MTNSIITHTTDTINSNRNSITYTNNMRGNNNTRNTKHTNTNIHNTVKQQHQHRHQ